MEGNGVQQYYEAIRNRLSNYIKSDYLANSETLLTYVDDILGEECSAGTNISREPYIETSASYKKAKNGIVESQHIPDHIKQFLKKLIDNKLGVFADPFEHQVFCVGTVPFRKGLVCIYRYRFRKNRMFYLAHTVKTY